MVNVNREILNKSHSPKRQKERVVKEKLESDLVVKNDFSAWLFIEELSFEGRKREQEGKKGDMQVVAWDMDAGESNKKQQKTETEHEGTKEGQTEEPE